MLEPTSAPVFEVKVTERGIAHIVKIQAATLNEALQRARSIWNPADVSEVLVLAIIDTNPQHALVDWMRS